MKKIISLMLFLLAGYSLNSCGAEDLLDVTIPTTISVDIPVNIRQGTDNFSETVTLSIDNSDTHDYLNKIKEVKIESLSYKFVSFSGDPDGSVSATLVIGNEMVGQNNSVIKTEADNGTNFPVDNLDQLNKIANSLKNGHSVLAKFSGTSQCPNGPMSFRVRVTMRVKIIANPIN